MIDSFLKLILIIIIMFFIILPVFIKVIEEKISDCVYKKIQEEEKHKLLERDIKQRKKGNQGKTLL